VKNHSESFMDIILEARDLFFGIDGREIFQGLNLRLGRGESFIILGASGSGKSVLLKLLSGLLAAKKGRVEIGGIDLASASKEALQGLRAKMGFVFQDAALISNMSIFDNVALPLRYHTRLGEPEVQTRVSEKMALFEVDRRYDRSNPAQISLGMRKRAALARALVLEPELLFLDEPTLGLGVEAKNLIARIFSGYPDRNRVTILMGTSEWPSGAPVASRIGLLDGGRIVAEGTAQEMQAKLEKMGKGDSLPK
jgi:phospholipid/cholesterol/gamma-HCH transport system ATP-binding protein